MADPFDVVDLADEDDAKDTPGASGAQPPAQSMTDPFDVADLADDASAATAPKPTMGTGNVHLDNLLKWYTGMAEAASLNNAAEVGGLGSRAGTALADLLQPSRERDGMAPEYAGRRGVDPEELVQTSMDSLPGKAGYVAGIVAPAVASGGATAAASIPTRAGVGAAQGAIAAGGDSGYDPAAMLAGGAAGGALAGLGGALGAKAESAVPLSHTTRAEQLMNVLSEGAKKAGSQLGAGAAIGALLSGSRDPVDLLKSAAGGALAGKAVGSLGGLAPKVAPFLGDAARMVGTAAAPLFGSAAGQPAKAQAQADVAYGTAPTMAWAVESVLTSGDTGLDAKDEQQLVEAVMSGDEDRVIAANFSLQQRSPQFAARLRRELESLQEE
jgi:hypothetical protein